jgi:hypothetical protein
MRKEVKAMHQNQGEEVEVREAAPLVFQLRELVLPGLDRPASLNMTQSSCGGEDTYE